MTIGCLKLETFNNFWNNKKLIEFVKNIEKSSSFDFYWGVFYDFVVKLLINILINFYQ